MNIVSFKLRANVPAVASTAPTMTARASILEVGFDPSMLVLSTIMSPSWGLIINDVFSARLPFLLFFVLYEYGVTFWVTEVTGNSAVHTTTVD